MTDLQIKGNLDPARALGLAVSYLMTKPAFARLQFGGWSRILVGQINRQHYVLALQNQKVVGFLGWAVTSRELAEQWASHGRSLSFEESASGDTIIINGWAADSTKITRALLMHLREWGKDKRDVYFKRFYPDGRIRVSRLAVNELTIEGHLARRGEDVGRP